MIDYKKLRLGFDYFCRVFNIVIPTFEFILVLGHTWLEAFMDPSMSTIVYVNRFGEAKIELAMWIVIIPICLYGMYLNINDIRNRTLYISNA